MTQQFLASEQSINLGKSESNNQQVLTQLILQDFWKTVR